MHGDKENNNYVLTYSDNGVGIPEHINVESTNTLGLQLIYGLAQQIKGKIELDRSEGTKFTIIFSDNR